MYNVSSRYKEVFFVLDIISIIGSYISLYLIYGSKFVFLASPLYAIELVVLTLLSNMFTESYRYIEIRGYFQEFKYTLYYSIQVIIAFGFLLIWHKKNLWNDLLLMDFRFLSSVGIVSFIWAYCLRLFGKQFNKVFPMTKKNILLITNLNNNHNYKKIVGDGAEICAFVCFESNYHEYDNKPVLRDFYMIRQFLSVNTIDEIFIHASQLSSLRTFLKELNDLGIPTNIDVTDITTQFLGDVTVRKIGEGFYITSAIKFTTLRQIFLKRLMDILGGVVGSFVCIIVGIIIYPIVQKQSPGPLIFKQKRVGRNGHLFQVYKFRSMYLDAEERKNELLERNELDTALMFKMKNDPRVFPFGQKLRDWSIDELPQFINVLKGEMSLVGTRPPTVDEYQNYELHHFKRLSTKPGITGMWQVSGRSDITDFEEVVALDYKYIQNWSIGMDIKIIFKTFKVVFMKEGSR